MIQIVKQHKVTGEIVKVDGSKWANVATGKIDDATLAKIKAVTEAKTDYIVVGQEGSSLMTKDEALAAMTDKDRELKAYYDNKAKVEEAMAY